MDFLQPILELLPPGYQSYFVQFGVGTVLTLLLVEFGTIPIGKVGASGLAARKRINAVVYASVFSVMFWRFGWVSLPATVVDQALWIHGIYVAFIGTALALIAMGLVDGTRLGKRLWKRVRGTDD